MNGLTTQMIGLVLVTHGRLADEFVTAMEHVVGPQEQVRTVAIGPAPASGCPPDRENNSSTRPMARRC